MRVKINGFIVAVLAVLFLFPSASVTNATATQGVTSLQVKEAYFAGEKAGVITKANMAESDFARLCNTSVIPGFEAAKQLNNELTFADYIRADNYEVPEQTADDSPTTISAGDHSAAAVLYKTNTTSASKGYSMKAGDILVCYGNNSDFTGRFIGH